MLSVTKKGVGGTLTLVYNLSIWTAEPAMMRGDNVLDGDGDSEGEGGGSRKRGRRFSGPANMLWLWRDPIKKGYGKVIHLLQHKE